MRADIVANLGGVICVLVILVSLCALVGAAVLQMAISFYNLLAGGSHSKRSVPKPGFGMTYCIVFVTFLIDLVVGYGLIFAASAGAVASSARTSSQHQQVVSLMVAQAISLPIGLFMMAGMLSMALSTTMGRALLVTLCYSMVAFLIGLLIGCALLAVAFSTLLR